MIKSFIKTYLEDQKNNTFLYKLTGLNRFVIFLDDLYDFLDCTTIEGRTNKKFMEKIYKARTDYKTCLNNTNNILYIVCLDKIWTEDFIDIIRRNFDNFKAVIFVYIHFDNNDELYPENDLWKACCVSRHYEIIHNKFLEIKEKDEDIKLSVINNMIEIICLSIYSIKKSHKRNYKKNKKTNLI